jgi:Fe-S cluster assembly ATP-binding protein
VYGGSITLDGADLLALPGWRRAQAGLFLAMQYPTEVPGVTLADMLRESLRAQGRSGVEGGNGEDITERIRVEAEKVGIAPALLSRPINVEFSGGEKKRNEVLQLAVLSPRIAVLDEIDSGLDIDALRAVARRVEEISETMGIGMLVITHYSRLLHELKPDVVSVLQGGRIVDEGGPELAEELERTGYAAYGGDVASG